MNNGIEEHRKHEDADIEQEIVALTRSVFGEHGVVRVSHADRNVCRLIVDGVPWIVPVGEARNELEGLRADWRTTVDSAVSLMRDLVQDLGEVGVDLPDDPA